MIAPLKDILGGDDVLLLRKSQRLEAKIYCDGASSGNPGHAGAGVVIRLGEKPHVGTTRFREDYKISEYIGIVTNNVAEYTALIRGLKEARSLGLKKIEIFLDSELLVKQINGIYRIKSAKLRPFWEEARNILKQFDSYRITHVQRGLNKEADLLAKRAIKNFMKI
jgi:ribonuclease HI